MEPAGHDGKTRLFVRGRVQYEDIFEGSQVHYTQWCHEITFKAPKGHDLTAFP